MTDPNDNTTNTDAPSSTKRGGTIYWDKPNYSHGGSHEPVVTTLSASQAAQLAADHQGGETQQWAINRGARSLNQEQGQEHDQEQDLDFDLDSWDQGADQADYDQAQPDEPPE